MPPKITIDKEHGAVEKHPQFLEDNKKPRRKPGYVMLFFARSEVLKLRPGLCSLASAK